MWRPHESWQSARRHQQNDTFKGSGRAPKAWVDIKLRELLKAAGYGRQTPLAVQAVYIAPPDDRRKERFHSHQAAVIRQPGAFTPGAELGRFVGRIKEVCA